jgi:hypothetical protein
MSPSEGADPVVAARSRNTVMATIAADARELLTDDAPT